MLQRVHIALSLLLFAFLTSTTTNADVPRPRGVALDRASLYYPDKDNTWMCLDGLKKILFTQINDDFCDCSDGSDEPGTSACSMGEFYCSNVGHRSKYIKSSRVNDGICDCCDGSDEYSSSANCVSTCADLGRAELEQRRTLADLHKRGSAKRSEMIVQGRKLKADRDARRAVLEQQKSEQESIRSELEKLKKDAESAEAEALEFYREQQREQEEAAAAAAKNEEESFTTRVEAEASFVKYDVNKDGFVEITELQVDMTLDRDRNGVVTIEEAKYFLDERDRINLETFIALSWPRIKPLQMLAQGLFTPPEEQQQHVEQTEPQPIEPSHVESTEEEEHDDQGNKIRGDAEEFEDEGGDGDSESDGEGEGFDEEEEADVGVGSVSEEKTPSPEYDPETQRLIDSANEARNAFSEVDRRVREFEQEIREIDEQSAKDYGPNEEYATMDGECYTFDDREYTYTLCPFDRASQKPRSGGSETTLGRWDQWIGEANDRYSKQKYSQGASCWNGPQRSAIVHLKCALEPRITSVSEPNRCEYFYEFETPAACDGELNANDGNNSHDEL